MRTNSYHPKEWKLVPLRELASPGDGLTPPDQVAAYWRANVATSPSFNCRVECAVVLLVNTRRRCIGHFILSTGTLDTLLVHPRDVFAPAIVANSAAVIFMHNHPSGDPTPSTSDISVTRDLIRAGQLLKIDVLDHVIMGSEGYDGGRGWVSLRELGYFNM